MSDKNNYNKNNQIKDKIYSRNQIFIASLFGGFLIASYLIAENFKVLGDKALAKKTLIISFVATLLFICILYFLPKSIGSKIIYFFPIFLADYIFRTYQSKKIEKLNQNGYKVASFLEVLGKCVISLVIILVITFLLFKLLNIFTIKFNYPLYLKNYCDSYSSQTFIKNTKIYVPEHASCFVYKQLQNKGYTLSQVDQVLSLEFEYQKSIGIVSNSQQVTNNSSASYNPLRFIKERQTLGISDIQINEILVTEDEYLKLIGVLESSY